MSKFASVSIKSKNLDSFGRLRVSEILPELQLTQLKDKSPLFFDEIVNATATSVWSQSQTTMSVTNNGDYVIRQSKMRAHYNAGKSQLVIATFDNLEPEADVVKRVGYYSSSVVAPYTANFDWLYMESSSWTVSVNVSKDWTVTSVPQASWDDPLDGTWASWITIDWTQGQILVIDFQWLGKGMVRWGIDIDWDMVFFHESKHANLSAGMYMLSPNQPIRYEIRSTGGAWSFVHWCASVGTEWTFKKLWVPWASGVRAVSLSTAWTSYIMKAMRLKSTHLDIVVDILKSSMISTGNDDFQLDLYIGWTVTGTLTFNAISNSAAEIADWNWTQTLSGWKALSIDLSLVDNNISITVDNALKMWAMIDWTSDVIYLVVNPLSNNGTFSWSINRIELV